MNTWSIMLFRRHQSWAVKYCKPVCKWACNTGFEILLGVLLKIQIFWDDNTVPLGEEILFQEIVVPSSSRSRSSRRTAILEHMLTHFCYLHSIHCWKPHQQLWFMQEPVNKHILCQTQWTLWLMQENMFKLEDEIGRNVTHMGKIEMHT